MAGNRDYLLVTLRDPYMYPGTTGVICGSTVLNCVSLRGMSPHYAISSRLKAVIIQGADGNWHVLDAPYKGDGNKVRLFLCHAEGGSPVGIRTSENWRKTHWGTHISGLPDVWIVACSLPENYVEFKLVRWSESDIIWEPEPFLNKHVDLTSECQVIECSWGGQAINQIVDIPPYKRPVDIVVTVSEDMDYMLKTGNNLVMHNVKDGDDNLLYEKGHQIPLFWCDTYQAYYSIISVPGKLHILTFSVAIKDIHNVVTHVDQKCFNQDGPRYRQMSIPAGLEDTIVCDTFVDVRPLRWRTRGSDVSLPYAGTQARSLYDLVHHAPDPVSHSGHSTSHYVTCDGGYRTMQTTNSMAMYRDIIMSNAPIDTEGPVSDRYKNMASNISLCRDLIMGNVPLDQIPYFDSSPSLEKTPSVTPNVTPSVALGRKLSRTVSRSLSRTHSIKNVRVKLQKLKSRLMHEDEDEIDHDERELYQYYSSMTFGNPPLPVTISTQTSGQHVSVDSVNDI